MSDALVYEAVSFAARAHQGQFRKDGRTPYVAHVMRVGLVVRDVFGIADPDVLAAALLHDTIEDTPTDYDDIAEAFGPRVAGWVGTLTKDMRLPEPEREAAYAAVLAASPWQVRAVKLADVYDNLADSRTLTAGQQQRQTAKAAAMLAVLKSGLPAELVAAFAVVESRLERSALAE